MAIDKLNQTFRPHTPAVVSEIQKMSDKIDELIDAVPDQERIERLETKLNSIGTTIANLEQELITYDEYRQNKAKKFKYYFVAKNSNDKEHLRCWRIYLRSQLIGEFDLDGSLTIPKFPVRFPFRFA